MPQYKMKEEDLPMEEELPEAEFAEGEASSPDDLYDENFLDDVYSGDGTKPMTEHKDLLKDLMSFDKNIFELKCSWLGVRFDPNLNDGKGGVVKITGARPMMNIAGVARAEEVLRTYLKGNHFLTDLDVNDLNGIMRDCIMDVWFSFGFHKKDYGIKNNEDLYAICTQLEHTIFLLLKGSNKGRYKGFLTGTYNYNDHPQPQGYGQQGYRMPEFDINNTGGHKQKGMFGKAWDALWGRNNNRGV